MVDEIRKVAERLVAHVEHDVVWLAERERSRGGNQLCVAPLQVWGRFATSCSPTRQSSSRRRR